MLMAEVDVVLLPFADADIATRRSKETPLNPAADTKWSWPLKPGSWAPESRV